MLSLTEFKVYTQQQHLAHFPHCHFAVPIPDGTEAAWHLGWVGRGSLILMGRAGFVPHFRLSIASASYQGSWTLPFQFATILFLNPPQKGPHNCIATSGLCSSSFSFTFEQGWGGLHLSACRIRGRGRQPQKVAVSNIQ